MRATFALILLLGLWAGNATSDSRVRHVSVKADQIVSVRTALGFATIIQVPDSPNSVVVGDQSAFKVEYLDRAITIKPLAFGAKSNLYVYTDWKRYNVQLIAGPEASADYIVYLENAKTTSSGSASGIAWTKFKNHLKNGSLRLSVNRLGRAKDGVLLVEFTLKGANHEYFKPEWLWVTQSGITRPIHNLFLSALHLKSNETVQCVVQLLKSDLKLDEPIRIELRREKTSYLTIPKVTSWK